MKISQGCNKYGLKLLAALFLFLIIGCSANTNLVPVGKDNVDASISLGGPFIPLANTKIPTPYLSVGANYGLDSNINLNANLHLTSMFYKVIGFDFGSTWFACLNNGLIPTWGIHPQLLMLASIKSDVDSQFRFYPLISSTAAWHLGQDLIYTGFDFIVPLTNPDYDKESVKVIFSPFVGYRWNLGKNLGLYTELKWAGANVKSNQLAVEYIKLDDYGALSFMFSFEKRF